MRKLIRFIIFAIILIAAFLVIRNVVMKSKNTNDTFVNDKKSNKYYQVTVSLLDKDTEEYISGAELAIETEDGQIIEKWTTKDEAYVILSVPKGKYVLSQVKASDGYVYNEDDTVFTVTDKNLKLVVYNVKESSESANNGSESGNGSDNQSGNGSESGNGFDGQSGNGSESGNGSNVNENVGVVDTLSIKNPIATVFGGLVLLAGISILVFGNKIVMKDRA